MKPTSALQIKVGLLILTALVVFGVAIFMMGAERRLFETRVQYEIHFSRTIGLRDGAPISLTGVRVGSVESLSLPADLRQNFIVVTINVAREAMARIRKDTVARIHTQGLLGDKFVELSGGSPDGEPLPPGSLIHSIDPLDYESLLSEGGDVVQNVAEITGSVRNMLKSIEEGKGLLGQIMASEQREKWPRMADNLHSASLSLRNLLASAEKGRGFLGQMIQDQEAGQTMMDDLKVSLHRLRGTADSLGRIAEKIEKGEGTLGTLIQDPDAGKEILTKLRRSASDLEDLTGQLRQGGGLLPRLIMDKAYADRVLGQLEQTTKGLAEITGKIERGEGTLGALVNDPELYKGAKEMVQSAKGSWLLSLFRFFRGGREDPPAEPGTKKEKDDKE